MSTQAIRIRKRIEVIEPLVLTVETKVEKDQRRCIQCGRKFYTKNTHVGPVSAEFQLNVHVNLLHGTDKLAFGSEDEESMVRR